MRCVQFAPMGCSGETMHFEASNAEAEPDAVIRSKVLRFDSDCKRNREMVISTIFQRSYRLLALTA